MTDLDVKMLKNMGALGYPIAKILSVMNPEDPDGFAKEFANPKSEIFKIYKSGSDYADYLIDLKLFEMSCSGDLKAIKELESRKKSMRKDEDDEF